MGELFCKKVPPHPLKKLHSVFLLFVTSNILHSRGVLRRVCANIVRCRNFLRCVRSNLVGTGVPDCPKTKEIQAFKNQRKMFAQTQGSPSGRAPATAGERVDHHLNPLRQPSYFATRSGKFASQTLQLPPLPKGEAFC